MDASESSTQAEIRRASPAQWSAALELLLRQMPPPARREQIAEWVADAPADGGLEGLWTAAASGELVGAVLARCLPGRSATVWPAQTIDPADQSLAQQLMLAALDWLAQTPSRTVQALLPCGDSPQARQLLGAGLMHLADMRFLVWLAGRESSQPAAATNPAGLNFIAYAPPLRQRLAEVVVQSYQNSLDCPALGTARDIDDVLDGYAVHGVGGTAGWFLVNSDGKDVGCLLLADDARLGFTELVYMGVVPAARGRGMGSELIRHAQAYTRGAGNPRLALAVDAANLPALALYTAAGFITWEERSVYFRRIGATADDRPGD